MNVPKLRFSEFEGYWESKKFEEISIWASGGTPPKDNPLYWNGNIPWISASSMRGIEYYDSELKITDEGLKVGSKLALKGSLLILVRGSMLFNKIPIGITSRNVAFNQDVKSIVIGSENYVKFVLYWFISSESVLLNMVTGTGIGAGKLDLSDLKSLSIKLPFLPEQQKIASFLTAVEDKLTYIKKKKALLEQYKKGVMQKLFSQEIRFKDPNGKEFPDWDTKTLGKLLDYEQPTKYIVESTEYDKSYKIPVLTAGKTFILGYTNETFGIFENSLPVIIFDDFTTATKLVDFPFKVKSSAMKILHPQSNGNIYFIYEAIKLIDYIVGGHERHWISKYSKLEIPVPCTEEQKKISNYLNAISNKIEHLNMQIEKTELWKKGLLQKMFV